jgi:hypothetical protein
MAVSTSRCYLDDDDDDDLCFRTAGMGTASL